MTLTAEQTVNGFIIPGTPNGNNPESDYSEKTIDILEVLCAESSSTGDAKTGTNLGAAATGSTATEYGNSINHMTKLAVSTTLPAIAGGAALAVGKLLYTFPAGVIVVKEAYMSLAITQSEGNITADTPDGGLGTTIGSGANATLDAVGAAAENVLTGQTFNDCDGTAEVITLVQSLVIAAGGDHTLYFNVADTWAASGDAAAALAGTVTIVWDFIET